MHGRTVVSNARHVDDQDRAAVERAARRLLARRLEVDARRPSALRLLEEYAAWAACQEGDEDQRDAALAALTLVPAARAEVDALESGVLFAAKTSGLTWAQMAGPLGLGSPQAVHQRVERLTDRLGRA
jgi:hypothetical protein